MGGRFGINAIEHNDRIVTTARQSVIDSWLVLPRAISANGQFDHNQLHETICLLLSLIFSGIILVRWLITENNSDRNGKRGKPRTLRATYYKDDGGRKGRMGF